MIETRTVGSSTITTTVTIISYIWYLQFFPASGRRWERVFFPTFFFFLFFNVFRPKAEINILNFYNDSFRQFQFQVVIINALLITT